MEPEKNNMALEEFMELICEKRLSGLPAGWWNWEVAKTAHQALCRQFIAKMPAYPERFQGKGIVICAGGCQLFANGYVCVRVLRHLGCRLPVQFWHLAGEMDERMQEIVAPFGVTCIDAAELDRRQERPCRILSGWELKAFALLHCPYEEVLLLDADNVPVVDPAFLFETTQYAESGAIFWPDYSRLESFRDIWSICEVPYQDEPEFESGQIVVDKRRCWRALQLARHYNAHSDFYYRHIHGDKDTFHMAFGRLGVPYAMPSHPIHALDATMCQHDFEGRRIFQHRNLDKWRLDGSNREIGDFQHEDLCRDFLKELRSLWSGRVYWGAPADESSRQILETVAGQRFRYHRVGYDSRELELKRDGFVGSGSAACERFWSVHRLNGDSVLTLIGEDAPTCHLRWNGKAWCGRWLRHEQMPIELTSLPETPTTIAPTKNGFVVNEFQEFYAGRFSSESIDPAMEYALKNDFLSHLKACTYELEDQYNIFHLFNIPRYCKDRSAFKKKYRALWSLSRTVSASSMIELGVLGGVSADAFLHARPEMDYLGIDDFVLREEDVEGEPVNVNGTNGFTWRGSSWARRLLVEIRHYTHVALQEGNIREVAALPPVELVVVDAAHDFHNQRRDLELALTAAPQYIYIDDYDGTSGEKAAVHHFLGKHRALIKAVVPIEYTGGGVLLALDCVERDQVLRRQRQEREREREVARQWDYCRVGHDQRLVELLPEGTIGQGQAALERSWRIDYDRDAVSLSIASHSRITCCLRQVEPGLFRGRWLTFERMPVELRVSRAGNALQTRSP